MNHSSRITLMYFILHIHDHYSSEMADLIADNHS